TGNTGTILVAAPALLLSANLELSGDISVGGTFSLRSMDTGIEELPGARILAGVLAVTAPGDITFRGDNAVATLGTVNVNGLPFRNVADLTIAGPVTRTIDPAVTVASGNLTVPGRVTATDGELLLSAQGNLTVGPGAVIQTGSAGGPTTLLAATPDSGFDQTL